MPQHIARTIHSLLIKNGKTVSVAESCSAGLLSSLLTRDPGSSQYFALGIAAYSNKAKETILNIPGRIIARYGAVSEPVAGLMAQSVKKIAKTDFGIAITGIAGPGGGTRQKPKGTVFIAVCAKNKEICQKFLFTGNRAAIRQKSALKALRLLKKLLQKQGLCKL